MKAVAVVLALALAAPVSRPHAMVVKTIAADSDRKQLGLSWAAPCARSSGAWGGSRAPNCLLGPHAAPQQL